MGSLKSIQQGSTLFFQITGELTLEEATPLRAEIKETMQAIDFEHVILDMNDVPFIDSSGIGMLVSLNTSVKGQGKALFLLNPTEQTRNTLELVQLLDFFHILDGEDELLSSLTE